MKQFYQVKSDWARSEVQGLEDRESGTGENRCGGIKNNMELINKRNEVGSLIGAKLWRTTKTNVGCESNLTAKKTLPDSNVQRIHWSSCLCLISLAAT